MSRPPLADPTAGDEFVEPQIVQRQSMFDGLIWNVVRDTVDLGEGGVVRREYLDHPGAVCVLALDEQERILLLRQYRHPVQMNLWEVPAGLLDVGGEPPLAAAQRELAEEADLIADEWHVLIDWFNSPGGSNEALRCYVARGLREVPPEQRHQREAEELSMVPAWIDLNEAQRLVLTGGLHNPASVISVLAACAARDLDWTTLRPADAAWPERFHRREVAAD